MRGLKIARNHSKYSNFFHRRNDFYVIDSNQDVLDFMFSSNLKPGRKSVSTFDFSTLYTSIPHDQLKCNLRQFVERIFSIKDKKYMVCNLFNKCAYFSDSDNIPKSYIVFNKSNLVECINYLIDNAFVVFNNNVYRQVIGIPMGTNSGPHVANIYLHQYEHEYFRLLFDRGKNDLLARLEFVFRFQDDLISFNDHGLLQDSLCEIYPPVMIVNNTNISACKSNFLDMTISFFYLFNTYFTLVVPTALLLQLTGQSQESEGSCKPARIKEVHSKLHSFQASLCTLTATHLTLIYVCTYIRLSVPLGCLIKQAGIIIHTILNMWETPGIEPVTSDLTSVYQISSSTN